MHNRNSTYFAIDASEGWVIFVHFKIYFRGSDGESPTSFSDRGNKLGRGAQNNRAYNTEICFLFFTGEINPDYVSPVSHQQTMRWPNAS